jgi:dTDP-glucose 4,6-dehydratase
MDWQGRRVLLTGAGGFIGSHLAERLVGLGARVRAFVRYTSRRDLGLLRLAPAEVRRELEVMAGDLRDADAVRRAAEGCEYIFHLGALIAIPYSYVHPREVVETNVLGTLNVLEAARHAGAERVIHTSTSEVYGTARQVPIDEGHPLQGQSPYSASKIGADRVAESYWRSFATPVVTLRPFNTYGPRQSARAVIPAIISQALAKDTIALGNLDATRDFTYVSDTVAGFLAAAEAEGVLGQEINLGTGTEISVRDLVPKIAALLGKRLDVRVEGARLRPERSEVERLLADNRKAGRLLGWAPRVDLDAGLRQTVAWVREHLDWYQPEVYHV